MEMFIENESKYGFNETMPCRISVYKTSDGKTRISRMDSGKMAAQIGGVVNEVMQKAFTDIENVLNPFFRQSDAF